jgi:hypothetical protein
MFNFYLSSRYHDELPFNVDYEVTNEEFLFLLPKYSIGMSALNWCQLLAHYDYGRKTGRREL